MTSSGSTLLAQLVDLGKTLGFRGVGIHHVKVNRDKAGSEELVMSFRA